MPLCLRWIKLKATSQNLLTSAGVAERLSRWPRDRNLQEGSEQASQWAFGLAGVRIPSPALSRTDPENKCNPTQTYAECPIRLWTENNQRKLEVSRTVPILITINVENPDEDQFRREKEFRGSS